MLLVGCETAPAATTVEPTRPDAAAGAEIAAEESRTEDSAVAEPVDPASHTSACVSIGLDLRVLGGNDPGENGIAMFVGSQAMHVREQTVGPPPEIWVQRGVGGMYVAYRADGDTSAMARCEAGVARYLETAPSLPILMEPAAQVTTPCEPCTVPSPTP